MDTGKTVNPRMHHALGTYIAFGRNAVPKFFVFLRMAAIFSGLLIGPDDIFASCGGAD